jgi:hypothetical protein
MLCGLLLLCQLDIISPCIILMETACICQHQVIRLAACYLVLIWLSSGDVQNYLWCAALAIRFEPWWTGRTIGKKSGKPSHHVFTAFSLSKWDYFKRKIDSINLYELLPLIPFILIHVSFMSRTWSIIIVVLIPLFRWANLVLADRQGSHIEAENNQKM